MAMFGRKKKPPKRLEVPEKIRFVGEQDGPPEGELKGLLVGFFAREPSIAAAYLARVEYNEESAANIALCIETENGSSEAIATKIGAIFASLFGVHEHLDILFLNESQKAEVAKVCRPFFCR